MCRATCNYKSRRKGDDDALRARLRELAEQRLRFGCPRLHILLKREGLVINHKRTERLYREERLSLRLRRRRKRAALVRVTLPAAERANQRWSMDFASDSLCTGRKFRALVIVDDYTKESPAIEVDTSIPGARVVRVLDRLAEIRGLPEVITVDNGPEFAGKALDEWAYRRGVKLNFIRPGKPMENAFAESFIGRLRDECLNQNWFTTINEAMYIIEDWRIDYNGVRPHSSLGNLSPQDFIIKTEKSLIYSGL
jgi:putative transposase